MDGMNGDDKVIEHLEAIRREIEQQNSYKHMFGVGIVYGLGFVLGSAILATVIIGVLGPWVAQISWVRNAFQQGSSFIHPQQ